MKLYKCKVLLSGDMRNQVSKSNVTAAEIQLLRHIHGGEDSVIDIEETGADTHRASEVERARLRQNYAGVIAKTEAGKMDPIMQLFGPDHLALPGQIAVPVPEVAPADQVAGLLD